MSTNFKKIKYHLCAFFVLSLSLLLLLTRYNYVFERSAQAFKLLFDSFVEWCNVFVLAAKQPGSELNIDTSISNFNFVNYLEINVDNLYFAFENLGNTLFDSNNFSFYSFWFFYFVIISILVFALSYAVLNFIGTVYEMVVYDFSENPYEDTKALAFFKKTFVKTYSSVKIKFLKFCTWFFDSKYKILFLITWFLNFNLLAIVVEFFGWFFYCMSCGNFWTCISTLLLDLALGFSSLPLLFWLILAVFVFHKVRKSRGDSNLFHLFNYCIGFLKSLGNNVLLEGPTGASKSKILVQMSRMKEVQFHTDQFDSINKFHIWFPDFPFEFLEAEIEAEMEEHLIYSKHTAENFIKMKKAEYINNPCSSNIWGYQGMMFYNDGFKFINIWDMLIEYAFLFYMHTNVTTPILSNISIRSDLKKTPGYFPSWNDDLTSRSANDFDELTQYCHINDFDTVRYTKQFNPNNERIGAVDYSIRINDECDKDRGNKFSNIIYDATDDSPNPLNDGYGRHLMLSRHEGSVDFKSYVWEGATMQRSDNFKADEKTLFDLLNIISKDGFKIAMPLFLEYPLLVKILSWYSNFNKQMKIYGKRRTLPYYIVTHACTPLLNYLFRIINRYGFEKVSLAQRKACNQDAEIELHDYFIIYCIAHNHLYRSDGFAGINDEIAKDCEIGLSDIPCYDGPLAQTYEYPEMHSYFANSQLDRIRKNRIKKQNLKK